jgi:hypothetical protein
LGIVSALTFDDQNSIRAWINHNGPGPDLDTIFTLDLPEWYDSNLIDTFNITLRGRRASPTRTISLFLKDKDKPTWFDVGSYLQPATNRFFSHTFDIMASGFDLKMFDSDSFFSVAYGCHFKHLKTIGNLSQSPVPEPSTMLLLGAGLACLARFGRKKFLKN